MPFFILDAQEKQIVIRQFSLDEKSIHGPDGWGLSFGQVLIIRCVLAFIYQGVQWWLLVRFGRTATAAMRAQNKALLLWMTFDTALKTLLTLFIFFTTLSSFNYAYAGRIMQNSAVAADLLLSAGFLIARPEILAGLRFALAYGGSIYKKSLAGIVDAEISENAEEPEPRASIAEVYETDAPSTPNSKEVRVEDGIMRKDMLRMEQYLLLEQPFLKAACDLGSLARGVHLPPRRVSAVINGIMKLSVPEYLNLKRLEYIEQKLASDPKWLAYKVDTMATEAGFASRAAFYKAFKRLGSYATPAEMQERYRRGGVEILFPAVDVVSQHDW